MITAAVTFLFFAYILDNYENVARGSLVFYPCGYGFAIGAINHYIPSIPF